MKRVAILISGGGSNMVKLLERLLGSGQHGAPCLVLSNVPGAPGLAKAAGLGVPTACVDHRTFGADRLAFEHRLDEELVKVQTDVICLAGFMRVLSAGFVAKWEGRMLNIHPSLLPEYPGLHTHRRVIEAGDTQHGCSVHRVTGVLDEGPILGQARLEVRAEDTAESLARRVLELEHRLYPAVLERFLRDDFEPLVLS